MSPRSSADGGASHSNARALGVVGAGSIVFTCALACSVPPAVVAPPPPIGQQAQGGAEATGTITSQVSGNVGAPVGSTGATTRGVGLGAGTGLTYQATRSSALQLNGSVAPGGSAWGGFARVGGRFNVGWGAVSTLYAYDAAVMEQRRRAGLGATLMIDVGLGGGAYNMNGGCTVFVCAGHAVHGYVQGDFAVHAGLSIQGVAELFLGSGLSVGSMAVGPSDVAVGYVGFDTGVRFRLADHLALVLSGSLYKGIAGALVSEQDANIVQGSFALQWTSPQFTHPPPDHEPLRERPWRGPRPYDMGIAPGRVGPTDYAPSPAPSADPPGIDPADPSASPDAGSQGHMSDPRDPFAR